MYSDAAGYESYMGRWSAKLAPSFLRFACRNEPRSILDIGCGTGSLLRATASMFPGSRLVGLDPYLPFVMRARGTAGLSQSNYVVGTTEQLPFGDHTFDHCLSLLVLQEIRSRAAALREMHRVAGNAGIVAACQWDFEHGMPMLAAIREALIAVAPEVYQRSNSGSAGAFTSFAELESCWKSAGFDVVETTTLSVTVTYENFPDFWQPILTGSTPTSAIVAGLPPDTRGAVGRKLVELIPGAIGRGSFSLSARAFAIRGRARNFEILDEDQSRSNRARLDKAQ